MADPELLAHWQRTESALRAVLSDATLPDDYRLMVADYLDHNELGLAWEGLRDGLLDPDPAFVSRLAEIGGWMGIAWEDPRAR